MSESTCYYYDEQHHCCNCYVNKNLNELLDENAKLRELVKRMHGHIKECCDACGERGICDVDALTRSLRIEVDG